MQNRVVVFGLGNRFNEYREKIEAEYDVVASLPNNTVLDITGEAQNGWYPVRAENGVEGYIIQTYVTMVGE